MRNLLLLFLASCSLVTEGDYSAVRDVDGDGFDAIRFGGADCNDNNPAVTDCDVDRDGFSVNGGDCDDTNPAVFPGATERCNGFDDDCDRLIDDEDNKGDEVQGKTTFYEDLDNDGYGDKSKPTIKQCEAPSGYVDRKGDCNDSVSAINPGELEQCDAIDHNCDNDNYGGASVLWFEDADEDGFGNPGVIVEQCEPPEGAWVRNSTDCDDSSDLAHPHATEVGEVCDGIDNDCDDKFDEEDDDIPGVLLTQSYLDLDQDGFTSTLPGALLCFPGDLALPGTDCDDDDPTVSPDAHERCDGGDTDCNGIRDDIDLDGPLGQAFFADRDGDGFTSEESIQACQTPLAPFRAPSVVLDCDDTNLLIGGPQLWFYDGDGDGYGGDGPRVSCEPELNEVLLENDCADDDYTTNPGALELCDNVDHNCDGSVEDVPEELKTILYHDADGDGYGDPFDGRLVCPQLGYVPNNSDCDDNNSQVNPGALERCLFDELGEPIDEDCDGFIDDEDSSLVGALRYYLDLDGDGLGDNEQYMDVCEPPPMYILQGGDCDDNDATSLLGTVRVPSQAESIRAAVELVRGCPSVEIIVDSNADLSREEAMLPDMNAYFDESFVERAVTISGEGGRVALYSNVNATPVWLTIRHAQLLAFDVGRPLLTVLGNGSDVVLDDVVIGGSVFAPMVLDGPVFLSFSEDPDEVLYFTLMNSTVEHLEASELLSFTEQSGEILLDGVEVNDFEATSFFARVGGADDLPTGMNLIFNDVSWHHSTSQGAGFVTEDLGTLQFNYSELTNLQVQDPLLCLNGVDACETLADRSPGASVQERPSLELSFSKVRSISGDASPKLLWAGFGQHSLLESSAITDVPTADEFLFVVGDSELGMFPIVSFATLFSDLGGGFYSEFSLSFSGSTFERIAGTLMDGEGDNVSLYMDNSRIIDVSGEVISPTVEACDAFSGVNRLVFTNNLVVGTSPFVGFRDLYTDWSQFSAVGGGLCLGAINPANGLPYNSPKSNIVYEDGFVDTPSGFINFGCESCVYTDPAFYGALDFNPQEAVADFLAYDPAGDSEEWSLFPGDDGNFSLFTATNILFYSIDYYIDLDGDGIPNAWELYYQTYFDCSFGPGETTLSDVGDSDGDGVLDSEEWLAGTNPCGF